MSELTHYSTKRESFRLREFWAQRLTTPELEANQSELLTRADILIDGLEMLVPPHTEAQRKLIREAVTYVRRALMVTHGAFVLQEQGK